MGYRFTLYPAQITYQLVIFYLGPSVDREFLFSPIPCTTYFKNNIQINAMGGAFFILEGVPVTPEGMLESFDSYFSIKK